MKKEEQLKNKDNKKISFFKGVENSNKLSDFFVGLKNIFRHESFVPVAEMDGSMESKKILMKSNDSNFDKKATKLNHTEIKDKKVVSQNNVVAAESAHPGWLSSKSLLLPTMTNIDVGKIDGVNMGRSKLENGFKDNISAVNNKSISAGKNKELKSGENNNAKKGKYVIAEPARNVLTATSVATGWSGRSAEVNKEKLVIKKRNVVNWSAPNVLSTNLSKWESTLAYNWDKKAWTLIVNAFLASLFIGFVYVGLQYWEKIGKITNEELQIKSDNLRAQIEKLKEETEEINNFNRKAILEKELLDKHIYWENFFDFLENNVLAGVYFDDYFSGGVDGEYVFKAHADSLKVMLDQVNYLRLNDKQNVVLSVGVANVVTTDTTSSKTDELISKYGVNFDLILKLNKNIFYKNSL